MKQWNRSIGRMATSLAMVLGACAITLPLSAPAQADAEPFRYYGQSSLRLPKLFAPQKQAKAQAPVDYVIAKFADHDIIFLGEEHMVADNLKFLQSLLPRLHAAGYGLGFEPVNANRQAELDKLLTGKRFDEDVANFLLLETMFNLEGYRDVLHAAWELNSKLPAGAPRFRITALDDASMGAVKDWAFLRPGEKGSDASARERVRLQLGLRNTRDHLWAEIIDREFIRKGQKAVIYGGFGHTTTRFIRERGVPHYRTVGNLIYDYIGERTFTILLHPTPAPRHRAQMVEELLGDEAGTARFGMDLQGTILGAVPSMADGYLPMQKRPAPEGFTLADIADGYIYLGPQSQWRVSEPIRGIYDNPKNLQLVLERKRIAAGDRQLTVTPQQLEQADRAASVRWQNELSGRCTVLEAC